MLDLDANTSFKCYISYLLLLFSKYNQTKEPDFIIQIKKTLFKSQHSKCNFEKINNEFKKIYLKMVIFTSAVTATLRKLLTN